MSRQKQCCLYDAQAEIATLALLTHSASWRTFCIIVAYTTILMITMEHFITTMAARSGSRECLSFRRGLPHHEAHRACK